MQNDSLGKFLVYAIFLGLSFLWFLHLHNSDPFDTYKEEFFHVVVHKKYKDPKKDHFMFVDGYDLLANLEGTLDVSFRNGIIRGLDSLYDYIEIGDTLLKEKDSPTLIVKNGARKRVFVGSSSKND